MKKPLPIRGVRKLIRAIGHLGQAHCKSPEDRKIQERTNYFCALLTALSLPYVPAFYFVNVHFDIALLLVNMVFLGIFWLMHRGHFQVAKALIILSENVMVFLLAIAFGPSSGLVLGFFVTATFPFIIFHPRQLAAIATSILFPIALCSAILVSDYSLLADVIPHIDVGGKWTYIAMVECVLITQVLVMGYFYYSNVKSERRLESTTQQLVHSTKMAALGEMSGNIAHEINTPLAAIGLRARHICHVLEKSPVNVDQIRSFSEMISKSVNRMATIVDGMRRFARTGTRDPAVPTSLRSIVDETLILCGERFAQLDIELETSGLDENITVECRPVEISQVLMNLLGNARDALKNQPGKRVIRIEAHRDGDVAAELRVIDNGPGVPKEVRDRIFLPFFTTKELGQGTGLGLSISKGIIEDHGGGLRLEERDQGTSFVICLPVKAA